MNEKISPQSLLIVYTGDGKGKSTAAFGMAFRAMGWQKPTAVVQFIKGKWQTGERQAAEALPLVDFHVMGTGFTWEADDLSVAAKAAQAAWKKSTDLIQSGDYPVVVLDELTYTFHHGFLDIEDVLPVLTSRPDHVTVVITGRDAPEELIDIADLVSEMNVIKHPYRQKNFKALRGVDF